MKNHVSEGNSLQFTHSDTRAPGDGVLVGALFGVCVNGGVSGDDDSLMVEGVFKLAAGSSDTYAVGAVVGWDDSAKAAVAATTGDKDVAVCTKAKVAGETSVECKLQSGL